MDPWVYNSFDAALHWAQDCMFHDADAAIVEEVETDWWGYLPTEETIQWKYPEMLHQNPWNFKQEDYFKGVRIRCKVTKRPKIE